MIDRIKAAFVAFRKASSSQMSSVYSWRGGWVPLVREPFGGAWQRNLECRQDTALAYSAVYRCVQLISSDVGKLRIKLLDRQGDIWEETTNPAYSPVLREPNHYQTRNQFLETWMNSKLIHGNTYALKHRDNRGVVTSLYVLDPTRVRPLVAPNGDVYYAISRDDLSRVPFDLKDIDAIPASEIIHDRHATHYHPLCGVSPITACGLAAIQGLRVQANSAEFFGNGSTPSGILTSPGLINEEQALQFQKQWQDNYAGPQNVGKVAVLGGGLTYEQMTMSAVDAQLIEQLKWTAENVCTAFGVPPYKIGVSAPPAYNNVEALGVQYYVDTIQQYVEHIESLLDKGIGLDGVARKTELDTAGLFRMDTATLVQTLENGKNIFTPNEQRKRLNLPPVTGGDTVLRQQQDFSLEALAKRDAQADPFASKSPVPIDNEPDEPDDTDDIERALLVIAVKSHEMGIAAHG